VRMVAAAAAIAPGWHGTLATAMEALEEAVRRSEDVASAGLTAESLVTLPEMLNAPSAGLA
jgi:hypothetical protein